MTVSSGSGDDIEAAAAAWAVRTATRELTQDEQQQLDHWLAGSSRHLGAYVRAQAIWSDTDRVAALDEVSRNDLPDVRPPIRWGRFAMAASVAVALIGGGVGYDQLAGRVTTSRDEVRRLVLDDGSVAVLNGDSALQVRYDGSARRVVLRRGEALFEVRHGDPRPFLVSAEDVTVRAVGTKFAVGFEDGDVEVTVEEGEVAVAGGPATAAPRLVRRNEQLVAAAAGARRAMLEPDEVERRLAWRQGLLVFDGQSLGRAAEEVNRYSRVPVTIDDPTLARAEFVGVFRIGDGRAFAHAAAQAFNGEVHEREGRLHLMRQQNSPSH
ncbi:FecR domain-containing protein [Sphingosinicella sp. LHD-64]|uniref:FecR family protein n=1 Tax=Sphingosinicella sp. LHD-64 TaxID=3072139 RepID=UPI00280F865C|nr:FecR domain-containing protein [Sphingosinicella sp. LHD-64]MDQ8754981.1 FecR domain-containing protein [Sphingosinicella sp. LHD-64]